MKKAWYAALIVLAAVGIVAAYLGRGRMPSPPAASPEIAAPPAETPPVPPPEPPVEAPVEPLAPEEVIPPERTETKLPEPVLYFPPPTVDLTGPKLGNQRVPGMEQVGDVHQLYFHYPTFTLFMAVTEPDGARSVWSLPGNGKPERVLLVSTGAGEIAIFGDSRGRIYVQQNNPCRLYRSEDGLKTWNVVLQQPCMFWQMADDGKGNVYGALHDYNSAVLFRSQDDGLTWEAWKDFQKLFPEYAVRYDENDDRLKLRHLHSVVYNAKNDALIVGTGDVARFSFQSRDGGETWKKVWDEGFTASVIMSGGDRYLLGPDELRRHGIALYDIKEGTVREVWNPGRHGYAGYTYSMINVDGVFYAAFHTEANEVDEVVPKFGIIVSPDGERWYRFLEWGPFTRHARTDIWLTTAPGIVYASVNGVLYAFRPLEKWWFEFQEPFE